MKKSLLLILFLALTWAWTAKAETITLNGNVSQAITPGASYDFYDSGGPSANYGTSENFTATFTSTAPIILNFSQFETESSSGCYNWDYMLIYDGDANTGTLLARGQTGCSSATVTVGVDIIAPSGTMTIEWHSDGSTTRAGWAATVSVEAAGALPKPTDLSCDSKTATTATLSWTEAGSATAWEIMLNNDENNLISANANPFTVQNLMAATGYSAKVRATDGSNVSAWSSAVNFVTDCEVISTYPWSENFDGITIASEYTPTSRTLPVCWSVINACTHNTYKYYPTVYYYSYTNYANSTPNCLRFYSSYSSYSDYDPQPQYAILPEMENLAGKQITLQARGSSATSTFKIGVMSNPADASTFVAIADEQALTTSYQEFVFDIPANATASYVAIMIDAANSTRTSNGAYIDDIRISEPPTCIKPTGLACSAVAKTTATLSWTNGANESAWQICLNDDENNLIDADANPFTVSGLEAATVYSFKVRANCASSDKSDWSNAISVATKCNAVSSFPWNEDFESYAAGDFADICWVNEHIAGGATSNVFKITTSTNAGNSTHQLQLPDEADGNMIKLMLPEMNLPANYQFVLDVYRSNSTYSPENNPYEGIRVFVSTDGEITGATELAFIPRQFDEENGSIPAESAAGWYTYQLPLGVSGNHFIILRGESKYCTSTYMDNFSVEEIPACPKPTDLAKSNIQKHSVQLSWTENGEAGSWKVAYKVDDESVTEFTEVDATINPYPLTGLLADTTYIVKVRANCGGGSLSDYSAELSVSTPIACIAPLLTNTGITNITAHSADVAWAGDPDAVGFTVSYRTAAYVDGLEEQFNTSGVPSDWARYSGLVDDVIAGTAELSSSTSWLTTTYGLGSYNAKLNIFGTSCKHWLVTPEVNLASGSTLTFDLALTSYNSNSAASGTCEDDRFVVLVFADDAWAILREWNNSDSPYDYNGIATSGENINIDLSAYNGKNIKIAFYGESTIGSNGDNDLHIDNVQIGVAHPAGSWNNIAVAAAENPQTVLTDLAAETNYEVKVKGDCGEDGESEESAIRSFTTEVACPTPTALQVSEIAPHQAKLSWTENGEATAWEVAYKLAGDADFGTPIAVTDTPYVLENLAEESAYVVKVRANCGSEDGLSKWSEEASFTTLADCPVPADVAADSIKGHSAKISWTGNALNEGYVLSYRTAAYMAGVNEEFGTSLPSGWENKTGLLSNVMDGSATLASGSQWVFGSNNGVFDNHARINIYGTTRYGWLITPEFTVPANAPFTFDLALTAYSGTGAASGTCDDDRFIVLIFADDEWQILEEWSNSTEAKHVFNDIPTAGENVSINLKSYEGKRVKVAFYGESTVGNNGDNNLHIDNVVIGAPVAAGSWVDVDNISDAEYTLQDLDAETKYEVVVQGLCAGNVVSDSSEIASFTTIESCVAPSALQVSEISNVSAKLSWIENGDAAAWIVAYKLASAEAFTEVDVLPADTPYIFSNLEAGKEYIVKVRANCGNEDGQSEWTTTKSFSTELCAPDDQCLLTFELTDSYGDSWNGNAILVTDVLTGKVLGEMANEDLNGTTGSDENEVNIKTLSVCNGREIQFSWVKGNYQTETSWVVKDVNGQVLFSGAGTSSMKTGDILYTHTVDCTRKFYLEIGTSGYATFYDADYAYTMPANLSGHTFNATTGLSDAIYEANQIIPAKEPLVMKAADNVQLPDTFILVEAETDALPSAGNDLIGVNAETYIADAADSLFYVLSLPASNNTDSVGFYWMKPYGAGGFIMPAHKAYLKLLKPTDPTSAPAAFYLFNGENNATWLNSLEGVEGTVKFMHEGNIYILRDSIIYDATGRKVRELK